MCRVVSLVCLFMLALIPVSELQAEGRKPNILLIVADDLGWNDVGYHGSEIRTPRIDELANHGLRLNRFYVQPSCSPTRASLITGKSSVRLGFFGALTKSNTKGLPLGQRTMPELLKGIGYKTALVGKWHLGHRKREYLPTSRGFDHFYGHLTGGIGYWDHVHGGAYDWQRNNDIVRNTGYSTHLIADEVITLIKEHTDENPLFLYASFNAPHLPNEAPEVAIEEYRHLDDPRRRVHAAMVTELDAAIGRVVDALDAKGVLDNTLIWFMSDNGGVNSSSYSDFQNKVANALDEWYSGGPVPLDSLEFLRGIVVEGASDNSPLRKGKRTVYEGGVRVPAFLYWKDQLDVGVLDSMISVEDVLPTALGMLGEASTNGFDGVDRWGFLNGADDYQPTEYMTKPAGHEALYLYPWKLIRLSSGELELYNVEMDPNESTNLVNELTPRVESMRSTLDARPRGESINLPRYKSILDPAFFGGKEERAPWLLQVN